jgi:hypothetical protein
VIGNIEGFGAKPDILPFCAPDNLMHGQIETYKAGACQNVAPQIPVHAGWRQFKSTGVKPVQRVPQNNILAR